MNRFQLSILAITCALLLATPPVCAEDSSEPWLEELIGAEPLTQAVEQELVRYVVNALRQPSTSGKLPPTLSADKSPRMIFASVSDGHGPARVTRGAGRGAARAIRRLLEVTGRPGEAARWIKVDLVRDVVREPDLDLSRPLNLPRSLYGLAFNASVGLAFLPEELVTHTLVDSDHELRLAKIGRRPGTERAAKRLSDIFSQGAFTLFRFSTSSYFVDSGEVLPLYRGHRLFNRLTPELLLEAARLGGEYLARSVKADGSFVYSYRPKTDDVPNKYNVVRPAGTVYSLLELYQVPGAQELRDAAERAIGYLRRAARPCAGSASQASCVVEGGYVKLGSNALAIVALAKHAEATGSEHHREWTRDLARWLLITQSDAGEFKVHKQSLSTGKNERFISQYYPGEALLALLRGGGVVQGTQPEHEPTWLDAAARGARWLIEVRDRGVSVDRLNHDHWLLYALDDLHRAQPDAIYLSHAERITSAILGSQNHKPTYRDWLGSYYRPPRSTPTATRSEGLTAAYRMQRDFGDSKSASDILAAIELGIRFQLQTQFRPESALYLPNPRRALGGFHRSLTNYEIRNDYVQHNISSLLALRRILLEQQVDR